MRAFWAFVREGAAAERGWAWLGLGLGLGLGLALALTLALTLSLTLTLTLTRWADAVFTTGGVLAGSVFAEALEAPLGLGLGLG